MHTSLPGSSGPPQQIFRHLTQGRQLCLQIGLLVCSAPSPWPQNSPSHSITSFFPDKYTWVSPVLIQGDRDALHTLEMHLERAPSRDQGFAVAVKSHARFVTQDYVLEYQPPCLVRWVDGVRRQAAVTLLGP